MISPLHNIAQLRQAAGNGGGEGEIFPLPEALSTIQANTVIENMGPMLAISAFGGQIPDTLR